MCTELIYYSLLLMQNGNRYLIYTFILDIHENNREKANASASHGDKYDKDME